MAKIPTYPELGKLARDLFRRGYHPGLWQIETKTMTSPGIELLSTGFTNYDNSKVSGMLQSKYIMEDKGLTLTEGWNTDRYIFGEIMQKDKLSEGLSLGLGARFRPSTNDLDAKFRVQYLQEKFHALVDLTLNSSYPVLNASVVMPYEDFLGGLGLELDLHNVYVNAWKVALGWSNEQATVLAELKDHGAFLASLFYKVDEKIDAGVELDRTARWWGDGGGDTDNPEEVQEYHGGDVIVSLGMIYRLDENAFIRAKINNIVELGLGYEQKFGEGITGNISAILDFRRYSGYHRIGVGVALQC
ncbi:voltage-dependent anion-selective channel [Drosophila kikkawai]|uniref:Voltage-dependent anion-selective channel n=1 Tax=Drosophila kikkawai TaxID=30033 RepID=A0A6P4ICI3_DROKI|nr:voltage-dependent anion-selective channel [Drosophila kikkawai]